LDRGDRCSFVSQLFRILYKIYFFFRLLHAIVLLTTLHQYIGGANIKKICEIGLLVLPLCNSLPSGGTGRFPPIYWCNWLLPPIHVKHWQQHQYIGGNIFKNLKKC
jgi:hypothetical protein